MTMLLIRQGGSTLVLPMESTEWVGELLCCVEGHRDESHGMILDELIPEAIEEWKRLRPPEDPTDG